MMTSRFQSGSVSRVLVALLALWAAGCGDVGQPVVGPDICVGASCDAQQPDGSVADGDATADPDGDAGADTIPQRLVNLYAETKNGNILQGQVNSATIQISDDKYPDLKGTQVDFVIQTTNVPDGTPVQITLAGQPIVLTPALTIANNQARAEQITIPCSQTPLNIGVTVQVAPGDSASVTKALRLNCDNACTASIDPYPSCLTVDADPATPGFQATFVVRTTTPDCTHAFLLVTDTAGTPVQSQKVALNGASSAPITIALAPTATDLLDATATVTASVEDQNNAGRPTGTSATETVQISTLPPSIAITSPLDVQLLLADDASPTTPGIQVQLTGTVSGLGSGGTGAVEVTIDGGAPQQANVLPNGTFQLPLSFTSNKTYAISAKATSACGLSATDTTVVSVYVTTASLALSSPAAGSTLFAFGDGNLTTDLIYETTAQVAIADATKDATVTVLCRNLANALVPVGSAVISDPAQTSLTIPISLNVASLGTAVSCLVVDNAPNPATSASVAFTVALPAPCLTLQLPADPALVVTNPLLPFELAATNLDGRALGARLLAGTEVLRTYSIGTISAGNATGALALSADPTPLADGTYMVEFFASDGFGNEAGLSLCSDVTRVVTLDTTGPAIALAAPATSTLTTFDNPDANPDQFGYQPLIQFAIADASEVCVQLADEVTCTAVLPTDTTVTFTGVSFQPGLNSFTAVARDAFGNPSPIGPFEVTLISDVPVVKFVQPSKSFVTAADSQNFVVAVNAPDGATLTSAVVVVLVDGLPVDVTVTDLGTGQYSFDLSGLSAKPQTNVQVRAAAAGAEDKPGFSSVLGVTFKSVVPTIAVTAPFDGQMIRLSSPSCAIGLKDCQRNVTATTTNVENGSTAQLNVVCDLAAPVTLTATVQNNAVSFTGALLPHGATCVLTARVTDAAGQQAVSAPNTVTVDRVAPVVGVVVTPAGKTADNIILNAVLDADAEPSNGLQLVLAVQVAGVPAGGNVTLQVRADDGTITTFPATSVAGSPDGTFSSVSFGLVTLPNGFAVQLTFSATDAAGNTGTKVVNAQVLAQQGEARITGPGTVSAISCASDSVCGANGRCSNGQCRLNVNNSWSRQIQFATVGMPLGSTVRLCTNTPGSLTTQGDCATAGWKLLGTTTLVNAAGSISFNPPDGDYLLMIEAGLPPEVPFTASLDSTVAQARSRFVRIDTQAPQVTTFAAPVAGGVPATCLAIASQLASDAGAPGGQFAFQVATSEPSLVTLRANGNSVGSGAATSTVAALTATVTAEGSAVFSAFASDDVGNIGPVVSLAALQVNTIPPFPDFSAPIKSPLIVGDSLDVQVACVDLDVQGTTVTVADAGVDKASSTLTGGLAQFPAAQFGLLSDGSHTLTATVRDTCANSAVVATSPGTILVDTVPPTATILTPVEAATFGDSDDASTAGGYQVSATFSTAGAVSWQLRLGANCDSGFGNCSIDQPVGSGNVTNAGGAEPAVIFSVPFVDSTFYRLRLVTTDSNGNTTTVDRGFKVQLTGCLVSLKGLSPSGQYNTQQCTVPGEDCASVTLSLSAEFVGPCGDVTAVRFKKGSTTLATLAPVDSKAATQATLSDGENTTFEAEVLEGELVTGSSGAASAQADLTRPTIAFISGNVLGVTTLAAGGDNVVGKSKDRDGTAADHQIHALLQLSDARLDGGKLVSLQRTVGASTTSLAVSSPALPQNLGGSTLDGGVQKLQVPITFATLVTDAVNTLTATVTDEAGNLRSAQMVVTVDWTPPAAIALDTLVPEDLNPRLPSAILRFAAVGDDGATGTATSYEVRYSRSPIADAVAFEAACDAAQLSGTTIGAPKATGTAEAVAVKGPDTRLSSDVCKFVPITDNGAESKYYFAVRAVDDAGNAGAISNVVETKDLRVRYARFFFAAPGFTEAQANDMRQRVANVGDLNGDGLGDLAFGGSAASPLCIVYGRANLTGDITLTSTSGTGHICLTTPSPVGAPVGRAADVNGDGVDDLIVGTNIDVDSVGSNTKSARIYLGVKDGVISTNPAVIFKNLPSGAAPGVRQATIFGNFNGDVAPSGKPLNDIAIRVVATATVTYDRVFIIPGNASWSTNSPTTIDLASSTSRNNNNVATVRLLDQQSPTGSLFGNAISAVGNLLPDAGAAQFDELGLQQYAEPQQFIAIKGRAYTGAIEIVISRLVVGSGANDSEVMALGNDQSTGVNNFCASAFTTDMDGDGLLDLICNHQSTSAGAPQGGLYVTWGSALVNMVGKRTTPVYQPAASGDTLEIANEGYRIRAWASRASNAGDFFGKGTGVSDLFMAQAAGATDNGGAGKYLLFGAFARSSTALDDIPSYAYFDLGISDVLTPGTTFSPGTPAADFNGDGRPDLILTVLTNNAFLVY